MWYQDFLHFCLSMICYNIPNIKLFCRDLGTVFNLINKNLVNNKLKYTLESWPNKIGLDLKPKKPYCEVIFTIGTISQCGQQNGMWWVRHQFTINKWFTACVNESRSLPSFLKYLLRYLLCLKVYKGIVKEGSYFSKILVHLGRQNINMHKAKKHTLK